MQVIYSIFKWFVTLAPPILLALHFLLIASTLFLIFYVWKKAKYLYLKIQQSFPSKKHVLREIKYSFYTSIIFGVVIVLVMWASKENLTLIYRPADKYGYAYFVFSILLMVVIHDAYFYWTHRLLHWKPLFKHVHIVHHLSPNPTPFSAYAFHPVEAFIEVGILPVVVFTVPYSVPALTIFAAYALLMNIGGHMGFEFFPKGFTRNKISKWHNTATHHNMHHRFVKYNFGLYFNIWDRLMKTNHAQYTEIFDQVVAQRELTVTPVDDKTNQHQTTLEAIEQAELMNEAR